MTAHHKETIRDWQYARLNEILKLSKKGVSKDELIRRFGVKQVEQALQTSIKLIY